MSISWRRTHLFPDFTHSNITCTGNTPINSLRHTWKIVPRKVPPVMYSQCTNVQVLYKSISQSHKNLFLWIDTVPIAGDQDYLSASNSCPSPSTSIFPCTVVLPPSNKSPVFSSVSSKVTNKYFPKLFHLAVQFFNKFPNSTTLMLLVTGNLS